MCFLFLIALAHLKNVLQFILCFENKLMLLVNQRFIWKKGSFCEDCIILCQVKRVPFENSLTNTNSVNFRLGLFFRKVKIHVDKLPDNPFVRFVFIAASLNTLLSFFRFVKSLATCLFLSIKQLTYFVAPWQVAPVSDLIIKQCPEKDNIFSKF